MNAYHSININYDEPVFRPPREWDSLIYQATIGCSRNSCLFCAMYKSKRFRIKAVEEIKGEISSIPEAARNEIKKIFIADGNAFVMNANDLITICEYFKFMFGSLQFISAYASPLDILEKSDAELAAIRRAGLKNLYIGIESGSDATLEVLKKEGGFTQYRDALKRSHDAGFVNSVTVLLGAGGEKLTNEHALETARLMNETAPRFINALTMTLYRGAPIIRLIEKGGFKPLDEPGIIREHYRFIENLEVKNSIYRSNHASNSVALEGRLPKDKERMLAELAAYEYEICPKNRGERRAAQAL